MYLTVTGEVGAPNLSATAAAGRLCAHVPGGLPPTAAAHTSALWAATLTADAGTIEAPRAINVAVIVVVVVVAAALMGVCACVGGHGRPHGADMVLSTRTLAWLLPRAHIATTVLPASPTTSTRT